MYTVSCVHMTAYLDRFIEEKIIPYKRAIQELQLPTNLSLIETIDSIIEANLGLVLDKKHSLFVPKRESVDDSTQRLYSLTGQLGRDLGIFIFGISMINLRMGEDYAELYSEIMAVFGADKERVKQQMLEELKEDIAKDRKRRVLRQDYMQALLN